YSAPALGGSRGGFWPQFHGPKRDNMSTETGLLKQWPKEGPRLAWKFAECGRGYAGVSVAEGRVFTSGDVGGEEHVLALDLEGRLLWKRANGKSWRGSTPGSRANPTWSDGAVYHLNPNGRLAALEATSGREIWAVDLQKEYGARRGAWGLCENVVVEGDKVLCVPGSDRAKVVALDRKTGKLVWANTEIDDDGAYCTPVIATYGGVRQLITLMRMSVVSVDVATGKLLWSHTHPSRYSQNVTSPLFAEGHLFVSSGHQAGGRMLEVGAKGTSVRELWYSGEFDNCHGGLMRLGDHLYGSGCRLYHKGLLCVEFATGKTVYRAESIGKVSITWADGLLYCIDQKGKVMLVAASPREARVVSHFTIPWEHKDQSLAHPVVCGGRLYIRHAHNLFAYDVRGSGR
ncbi:PQQ-binding-like beta-propeller repeat protein, partial [Planctomycetota bacterium]